MSKMKMNKAPLNEIASPRFDVDKYSPEEKKEVEPQKRSAKKIRINKYMYSQESEERRAEDQTTISLVNLIKYLERNHVMMTTPCS